MIFVVYFIYSHYKSREYYSNIPIFRVFFYESFMITDELGLKIRQNLVYLPTLMQEKAIEKWSAFLLSRADNEIFLMKGYAGTGKSSLVGALVQTLTQLKQNVVLLAPTGRAAKVMSLYAQAPAYTIHKRIYRQKTFADMDSFQANVNLKSHTLFIVDEASMIANEGLSGSIFGTGRLLDDLVHFVYSCEGCRLMLVGDTAQLPPVGEEESPALCSGMLQGYGLNVTEIELTEVVRQTADSGILWNATSLRQLISNDEVYAFPRIRVGGFADIRTLPGNELIEALEESYYHCGTDQTIVVTRSNRRAIQYNQGIRGRILGHEEELSGGDLLMVAKNNYFWCKDNKELPFIANGDVAVVRRFRNERSLYGFRFADVTLQLPDYDDMELDAVVLLDTLRSEASALTRQEQEQLFHRVWEDYPEITNKQARAKKIKEDTYYNALQVKYAYAVTCHKAQGGQWQRVFIDQGYVTEDMLSPDYFRWLYTAITRATETVYLVNWPENQLLQME